MKTSQDYPLEIDSVIAPGGNGRIGMTICRGKTQSGAMTGDWARDLALDLDAIRAWGASVIVNLIEDHAMVALGVQDTEERLPAGIAYLRLPIPDFGVPGAAWEARWAKEGPLLIDRLHAGQNVLLHCKGGLGRTGMIAARILVEMGLSAEQAIKSVREARPGTIETAAQEAYVRTLDHG
jgi:ADP-ribosyl-[dinitrogen reductase] hydrolase